MHLLCEQYHDCLFFLFMICKMKKIAAAQSIWHISTVTYGYPCGHINYCQRLGLIWTRRRKCNVLPFSTSWIVGESWTAARWRVLQFQRAKLHHSLAVFIQRHLDLSPNCQKQALVSLSNVGIGTILRSGTAREASGGGGGHSGECRTGSHSWHRPLLISHARYCTRAIHQTP